MKLIIDIDNNDYELINKTGVTLDLNTVFHGKEKDKEMAFAIFDLVKALKNSIPYEERPLRCKDCKHLLTEFEEVKGDICGNCANWRCDDPLHMVGHCIAYRHDNVFHGRMCNPPCTKFER